MFSCVFLSAHTHAHTQTHFVIKYCSVPDKTKVGAHPDRHTDEQTLLYKHLYFAACSSGSALLLSIEVLWKQCSDEGSVRRRDTENVVSITEYFKDTRLRSFV